MAKTADQFQSYHQERGTLLVLSVVLPCLEGQFRHLLISALLCCQEGLSSREVSRYFRLNKSDVVQTWRRYRDTGAVDDMHCSGCPRATTAVDDRYLQISARRNPESNTTMLNNAFTAATGRCVLTQTVRNRLHDAQLHSQRPWQVYI